MKRIFLLTTLIVLVSISTSTAQEMKTSDYSLSDVTISSGRGALSNGIFASATVTNGTERMYFQIASNYVQAMYGENYGCCFVSGSAGFYDNTPWVGPYIVIQPFKAVTFTTWWGIFAGTGGHPGWKPNFSFAYNSLNIGLGPVYIAYTVLHYQKDVPNNLPGIGLNLPLGTKISSAIGCDYSLRDKGSLFSASLTYSF